MMEQAVSLSKVSNRKLTAACFPSNARRAKQWRSRPIFVATESFTMRHWIAGLTPRCSKRYRGVALSQVSRSRYWRFRRNAFVVSRGGRIRHQNPHRRARSSATLRLDTASAFTVLWTEKSPRCGSRVIAIIISASCFVPVKISSSSISRGSRLGRSPSGRRSARYWWMLRQCCD